MYCPGRIDADCLRWLWRFRNASGIDNSATGINHNAAGINHNATDGDTRWDVNRKAGRIDQDQ